MTLLNPMSQQQQKKHLKKIGWGLTPPDPHILYAHPQTHSNSHKQTTFKLPLFPSLNCSLAPLPPKKYSQAVSVRLALLTKNTRFFFQKQKQLHNKSFSFLDLFSLLNNLQNVNKKCQVQKADIYITEIQARIGNKLTNIKCNSQGLTGFKMSILSLVITRLSFFHSSFVQNVFFLTQNGAQKCREQKKKQVSTLCLS